MPVAGISNCPVPGISDMLTRKRTKSYPESFPCETVRMANQSGQTGADVVRELEIHTGQIYNWLTQFNKAVKKSSSWSRTAPTIRRMSRLRFES